LFLASIAQGAEVIPQKPPRYVNDYASVLSAGALQKLNSALENFEKETSSQIVVVIYPKMQSDSSIEDYTVRIAQKWGIGQKTKDNGAILFVFIQNHTMRIEVGYGLEGAIPDITAKRIIEDEIAPQVRSQNYDAGISAGVNALMAASKGEYKGSGRTNAQRKSRRKDSWIPFVFFALFLVMAISSRKRRSGRLYQGNRWGGPWIGGGWGGGSGSGWSGGGGGGGGGWMSSGGGGFGGGGSSGSW
jgi:uncharacterized protein